MAPRPNEEWAQVEPLLPKPAKRGRKPEVDLREILNAIRYMARFGHPVASPAPPGMPPAGRCATARNMCSLPSAQRSSQLSMWT